MKYIMKHIKSIFYTLIILFFCIVDQRRGSAPGQVQFVFVNLAGVAVCLLMFSAYKLKEFFRWPYWVWSIIFAVGGIAVTYIRGEAIIYRGQWYTALINVWLIGLLVIKMISKIFIEKYRPNFSKKALVLFLGFMLLACFSRNDSLWTWWYLVLFTLLYLTDFSLEDRERLFNAIPNGIILGFFVIQGLAFVFRPYDVLRYPGLYANENMNALFYSLVYCAFLGKYCLYYAKDKEIKFCRFRRITNLFFCGAMWSFVCFTMCRSAMLSMAVATACAGIYCLFKVKKHIFRNALGMVVGLAFFAVVCTPITYCAVRYLPPVFHHPIWFGGEYSTDRVHSWDPIDSQKYITWEQIADTVWERLKELQVSKVDVECDTYPRVCVVFARMDKCALKSVLGYLTYEEFSTMSTVDVRMTIFGYYFKNLNLMGHTNNETIFEITDYSCVPHAHNLLLQMAFMFGIPAGIFFVGWIGCGIIVTCKRAFGKNRDAKMAMMLLYYINIIIFGMVEIVWLTGQLSFILLFLAAFLIFGKNGRQLKERD